MASFRFQVYTDVKNQGKWATCFEVKGVHLPAGMYFGVSSSTGHLADNHDIFSIVVSEGEELSYEEAQFQAKLADKEVCSVYHTECVSCTLF